MIPYVKCSLLLMRQHKSSSTINNQGSNKVTHEENENSPDTKLKVLQDSELNDREFKIAVRKKLCDIQEHSKRQFNELRNKISEKK